MASPKYVLFFIYHQTTGAPLVSQTPVFYTYKNTDGTPLSQPTIVNLGDGAYGFIPTFADVSKGIIYEINTDTNGNPVRLGGYLRPEDWNLDNADAPISDISFDLGTLPANVQRILDVVQGKWEIKTVGDDANHLILYESDGTTVLRKFLLTDSNGVPTYTNPFKRTPV